MKTALILLSILGMACAFSMKNFHRRAKLENSEENGVFKYRPRYYLYKHAYFYPPLKRFPVQSSDSSEENEDGDSSEEEEEEETSNEEENNEESNENEDEESEAENSTLSAATPGYGEETTPGTGNAGLAAIQLPKKAGDIGKKSTKKEESDEEEEEEEEEDENEENEAEVDENGQGINGTSTNSTETENGNGSSGGDNGEEEGEEESVPDANAEGTTVARDQDNGGFEPTTPPQEVYGTTPPPLGGTTTTEYGGEYEQTGTNEYDNGYEVYENEHGEPRGDNYRAYEDEYSYYKGHSYDGYDGQNSYYH